MVHAMVKLIQVVSLNVAFNSFNSAMTPLLVSSQFLELKSHVFKRFRKDNLFKVTCSGEVFFCLSKLLFFAVPFEPFFSNFQTQFY